MFGNLDLGSMDTDTDTGYGYKHGYDMVTYTISKKIITQNGWYNTSMTWVWHPK